jgi:hypothetical protein
MSEAKKIYNYLSSLDLMNVPVSKLLVPAGMYHSKWHSERRQKYLGGASHDALEHRFSDNAVFHTYMKYNDYENKDITPSSLVPLGVLIYVYNDFNNKVNLPKRKKDLNQEITIQNHDLSQELMKTLKIDKDLINPGLKVPFSLILGRDLLSYYGHKNNGYLKNLQ